MTKANEIFNVEDLAMLKSACKIFGGKVTKIWSWDPAVGPTWADGSLMKGYVRPEELTWE